MLSTDSRDDDGDDFPGDDMDDGQVWSARGARHRADWLPVIDASLMTRQPAPLVIVTAIGISTVRARSSS